MSENKTKHFVNLSGTEVDFSGVATDSVPEVDISDDILEEKLSYLMLWQNPSYFSVYTNRPAKDPCWDCENYKESNPRYFIPDCRNGHNSIEYVEPCDKKRQFLYPYENNSFLSYANGNMVHVCEDEGIPFRERCAYGKLPHYDRTLRDYFKESGIYSPAKIDDAIVCHQTILGKLFDHFYPKQTNWRPPQQASYNKKDSCYLPLSFRFNRESGVGDSLVLKAYSIWDNRFLKAYYPVSLVHLPGTKPKELQYSVPDQIWAKIPREDRQKLYNLDKIITAKKVVICAAIEDAWILQRTNDTTDVVFTSFKCDGWKYDQVDFSELKDKEIIILISNYNGSSLAEEYCDTKKLVSHLESIKISNVSFVQREIVYPSIEGVWSYQDLVEVYKNQPPMIKDDSLTYLDMNAFRDNLEKAKKEMERKKAALIDLPFYLKETGDKDETENSNSDDSEEMLIRPFVYKHAISMIAGPEKVGKSIFATMLCGLYASKSHKSLIDGMAFVRTTTPVKKNSSSIYVAFESNVVNRFPHYRKAFVTERFGEQEKFFQLNMVGHSEECYQDHLKLVEAINNKTNNAPIGLIVIDSLSSLAGTDYMSAVQPYSNKLMSSFPDAAIVWIHHVGSKGVAGGYQVTSVPLASVILEPDSEEDLISMKLIGNPPYAREEKGDKEKIKLRITDNCMELVSPKREEEEMRLIIYEYYRKMKKNSKVAAGRLGYADTTGLSQIRRKLNKDNGEQSEDSTGVI